jgi:hypothetical protein
MMPFTVMVLHDAILNGSSWYMYLPEGLGRTVVLGVGLYVQAHPFGVNFVFPMQPLTNSPFVIFFKIYLRETETDNSVGLEIDKITTGDLL